MPGFIAKKRGRFYPVVDLGQVDGTRKLKWHAACRTKGEAKTALNKLLTQRAEGVYVEPSKLTVKAYLEKWLTEGAKPQVAAKTLERYREILDDYVIPTLGGRPLAKLTPLEVQALYRQLEESGRRRRKTRAPKVPKRGKAKAEARPEPTPETPPEPKGLSAMTVLHVHQVFHAALARAVRWNLVVRNVADAVEPPRPTRTEMAALDEAQVSALLAASAGHPLHVPLVLAVLTGLRRGELFGLKWGDLDLDAGTLTVRRSLEKTKAGVAFKEPKTTKSRRVVTLPALAVSTLRRYRAEQAERHLAVGRRLGPESLVFLTLEGTPADPDTVRGLTRLCAKAKVPRIRWHDLRHTHASLLLKAGVGVRVVADRLGHATPTLTMNTYAHVLAGQDADAAAKLEAALKGATR